MCRKQIHFNILPNWMFAANKLTLPMIISKSEIIMSFMLGEKSQVL